MPPSPVQLKDKLLKTIDEDHNITNLNSLLEVITLLERTALTREDLTTTRLGLYVNNVRKKAPADLGKRLRQLVKSWQTLVNSTPSNNASPASGYSPAFSAANSPRLSTLPVSSPRSQYRATASPALQPSKNRLTSPAPSDSAGNAQRLVSPLVRQAGAQSSPKTSNNRRISPSNAKSSSTPHSNTPLLPFSKTLSSRPDTPNGNKHFRDNVMTRTPTPPNLNNHLNTTPNIDNTNRTHAANKKRRRSDESNASDNSSIKKSRTVINGEATRVAERIRAPKVKTTVEIIAELQAGNSTRLTTSDTITKIVTNQIAKEEDDIHTSVVPPSALPRSRRKQATSGLPVPAQSDLRNTRSDLLQRYILQQTDAAGAEEYVHLDSPKVDIIGEPSAPDKPTIDISIDPYTLLPPLDYDNISWSSEDDNGIMDNGIVCRNPITGEYPDGYEPTSGSSEHDVESRTEKFISEDWHGVNGTMNVNSQFHPWTETFTISPCDEEQTDSVHVLLPYVDL